MRKNIAFTVLVGSHNYRLNREESDKDWKSFFYPNFEDLYYGDKNSISKVNQVEDVEYHDIRKLPQMLYKSNVNFVEVLFSTEVKKSDSLYQELKFKREDIARMNLPYLFDACFGMYERKYKEFVRDTNRANSMEGEEEELKKKYCKHAMVAYRILDFLERYAHTGFESFAEAIVYDERKEADNYMKYFLFDIRDGKYGIKQLETLLQKKKAETQRWKEIYKSKKVDEALYQWIEKIVKQHVYYNLQKELQVKSDF